MTSNGIACAPTRVSGLHDKLFCRTPARFHPQALTQDSHKIGHIENRGELLLREHNQNLFPRWN